MQSPAIALRLLGVPIHDVTMDETVQWIDRWIAEGGAHQIATVNPEFLMKAQENSAFKVTLRQASLCIPDGIGIVLAARLRGHALRERVAGSDLVPRLGQEAAQRGWRVFFLGAAPGIAERTAEVLSERHPGLPVAGCYAGSPAVDEEAGIIQRVRASDADLLLVAYGAPKQDLWLMRNLALTGAAVGIGVGGSFDFVAGISRRAPRWVQRLGLEWLHRLVQEPWRWRRQLALPRFVWQVLFSRGDDTMPPQNDGTT